VVIDLYSRRPSEALAIAAITLAVVAIFVPSPFNLFLFLGAIFSMVWEVADWLREHYEISKQNQANLERITELLESIESNTENTASYLYENTEAYRRQLIELDEP